MKILLIEPPFYRLYDREFSLNKYPLSLGYLTAVLKTRTHHEVMVYNADFSKENKYIKHSFLSGKGFENYINNLNEPSGGIWNEVQNIINEYNPDVVGITSKSQNFKSGLNIAKISKKINPGITTVIGGPHPTILGKDSLNYNDLDFAVVGEGEITFYDLINALDRKSNFDEIPGLIWRNNGRIVSNPGRPLISDLDSIPNPYLFTGECLRDYSLFPDSAFRSVFATRGCPFNCSFCGSRLLWSRKVRFRSPQNVVDEIKYLQSMGIRYVNFDDDTFGVNRKYLKNLCDLLRMQSHDIKWSCEIHIKLLNEEILQLMKSAGCDLIKVGIESGNNQILKEIHKNITIEEALQYVRMINKEGISTMSFFMVGFPQETESSLMDTLSAIKKVDGMVTYSIFTPYMGTEAHSQCMEMNLIPEDFDVALYNHQSPNNCFTRNIPKKHFREIAGHIERIVDRKNAVFLWKHKLRRITPRNIMKHLMKW